MIRSLWTAATGMVAQQLEQDVVANNLANVNTSGFKKSRADFMDLMYQIQTRSGSETTQGNQLPVGIEVGMGVKPTSTQKIFTQGDYQQTGNKFDWAIERDGFFPIRRQRHDRLQPGRQFENQSRRSTGQQRRAAHDSQHHRPAGCRHFRH